LPKKRSKRISTGKDVVSRVSTWPACSELPPSAKKSSWVPIPRMPRTSCHASAITRSMSVVGGT
jgi:hypothetical protein